MSQPELWNWSNLDLTSDESFLRFHGINNQTQCRWNLSRYRPDGPFRASIELARVGECTLSRARTDPLAGHRDRAHIDDDAQDFFTLMYMAEGALVFCQQDNESYVRQHHLAFWDSARPAATQFREPIRQLHVMIPRATAIALIPGIEKMCGLALDGDTPLGRILRAHLVQLADRIMGVPPELRPMMMDPTLQLIGASFHPEEAKLGKAIRRPTLLRIEKYILAYLNDPELSVTHIADALSYTPRHVHRIFDGFDFSVSDWIRRRRLLAARAALAGNTAPDISIAQVAYRYGFRDPAHFSRASKTEFGVSPTRFRASSCSRRGGIQSFRSILRSAPGSPSTSGAGDFPASIKRLPTI